MLIVISGLPGTGKSSVAKKLAQELGAKVLSTDEMRKRVLRELGYTERKKKQVYEEMFRIARDLLDKEEDVVLDGTFFRKEWRDRAFDTAKKDNTCIFFIETVCAEDLVKRRIESRYKSGEDYSEADYRVYKIIESKFEPMEREHFEIDTSRRREWSRKVLDLANRMRVTEQQEKVIDGLRNRYNMCLLQTHISWVLLDGRYAFKVKKPVRFDFVDYSTLKRRKRFCVKEKKVNAVLASDLYLGVVPVKKSGESLTLDRKGKIVEYAVKMVELPQKARMDNLIRAGEVRRWHIEKIAAILADFHQKTDVAFKKYGSTETIRDNFSPCFETGGIVEKTFHYGQTLKTIKEKVDGFINENEDLFARRIQEERIKKCHGDARTKNIFIYKNKITIFDAVEFSSKISSCDVSAEIAYLAMDLKYYGKKKWAEVFIEKYIELSKDHEIRELIDFYVCYRALVEAMVETYTMEDPEIEEGKKRAAGRACKKYLDLAFSFAKKMQERNNVTYKRRDNNAGTFGNHLQRSDENRLAGKIDL
jgi:aminoglycoside phosphotransferase family enzyme/predicted kinase